MLLVGDQIGLFLSYNLCANKNLKGNSSDLMFVVFSDSISNAIKLYNLELKWILQTEETKAQRGLMSQ